MENFIYDGRNPIPSNYTGRILYPNDCIEFRLNGLVHRSDGPARIYPRSEPEYWIHGKFYGHSIPEGITDVEYYLTHYESIKNFK